MSDARVRQNIDLDGRCCPPSIPEEFALEECDSLAACAEEASETRQLELEAGVLPEGMLRALLEANARLRSSNQQMRTMVTHCQRAVAEGHRERAELQNRLDVLAPVPPQLGILGIGDECRSLSRTADEGSGAEACSVSRRAPRAPQRFSITGDALEQGLGIVPSATHGRDDEGALDVGGDAGGGSSSIEDEYESGFQQFNRHSMPRSASRPARVPALDLSAASRAQLAELGGPSAAGPSAQNWVHSPLSSSSSASASTEEHTPKEMAICTLPVVSHSHREHSTVQADEPNSPCPCLQRDCEPALTSFPASSLEPGACNGRVSVCDVLSFTDPSLFSLSRRKLEDCDSIVFRRASAPCVTNMVGGVSQRTTVSSIGSVCPDRGAMRPLLTRLAAVARPGRSHNVARRTYDPLRNLAAYASYQGLWHVGPRNARGILKFLGFLGSSAPASDISVEEGAVRVSFSLRVHLDYVHGICAHRLEEPGLMLTAFGAGAATADDVLASASLTLQPCACDGAAVDAHAEISALRLTLQRCVARGAAGSSITGTVQLVLPGVPCVASLAACCQFASIAPSVRLEVHFMSYDRPACGLYAGSLACR